MSAARVGAALAMLLAAVLPLPAAPQPATPPAACVDDALPGRFSGAPLRLCSVGEGEQRRFVLSIAAVERLQADIGAVRDGAVADWAGHALGLRCDADGRDCRISVDGRAAWQGRLPVQAGTAVAD